MLVHHSEAAARFLIKHTHNVDVHADNLNNWEQHYEQTSPGCFKGEVHELVDGPFQVFHEVANCATAQHCAPWRGGVWVGISTPEADNGLRFMGRPTGPQHLMVASGDSPFDLQVPANHGLYGLVVEHHELDRHMQQLHHQALPFAAVRAPQVQGVARLQRMRLVGMLREVLRGLDGNPTALAHDASRKALKQAVLTVLTDTLLPQSLHEAATPRQLRRHALVQRARDRVLGSPDTSHSVADLCSHLHVTRRTLQNSFQDTLGLSPTAFLRSVRLNAVRRALREPGHATIAETAARWGFWHMGHFSQEYKALFGETPSQTRHGRDQGSNPA